MRADEAHGLIIERRQVKTSEIKVGDLVGGTQSACFLNERLDVVPGHEHEGLLQQVEHELAWLGTFEGVEGYGLGDLWEKNLLGARP